MSNTVHPPHLPTQGREQSRPPHSARHYARAGAVATSTQRPPLRRGGSTRDLRPMLPFVRSLFAPFASGSARPLVPRDLRPPLRSLRASRTLYRPHGALAARVSRPCSVSGAVFRPLLLPAPVSVGGAGVLCSTWKSSQLLSATLHLLSSTLHLLSAVPLSRSHG